MNSADQLSELLLKVDKLSNEVELCHREILLLKSELEDLRKAGPPFKQPGSINTVSPATVYYVGFENFIGLKLIHFVGIIVLIIGLTIGVKYAIDIQLISPLIRIVLAYLAGIALFFVSLKLRKDYELFSVILLSGAMASIYFTTYAAFEYYALIGRTVAFALMLLLTLFTVYNSLKYNRQEIAILSLVGAYGIPFFVGSNTGNIFGLFSFIFLVNTGILYLSTKKYWLTLTYLAFFTTWIIYLSLHLVRPGEVYNNINLFFAVAFFILFLVSAVGSNLLKGRTISDYDNVLMIFNSIFFYVSLLVLYNSVGSVSMQQITVVFGIFYLITAFAAKKCLLNQNGFTNALFSIALVALVIYVAMKFEGFTVTIIWVLMAVLLFIIGMWYKIKMFRIASIILFATTLVKLLILDSRNFSAVEKVIAYIFTGTILLIVSFLYQKFKIKIFSDEEE